MQGGDVRRNLQKAVSFNYANPMVTFKEVGTNRVNGSSTTSSAP